jgi:hypothetical protein
MGFELLEKDVGGDLYDINEAMQGFVPNTE